MTPPDWLTREAVLLTALGLAVAAHALCLAYYSRTGNLIRVTDLLTGDNGRMASTKTFQAWAFVLSAWAMIWFTATGHADPLEWSAWVAIWAGAALTNKAVNNAAVAKAQENATAAGQPAPTAAQVIGKSE